MADQTSICNIACAILGSTPINAITDETKTAITLNSIWNAQRDSELRKHIWKFSIQRAQLPLLSQAPVNGPYSQAFALPAGCLRVLQVGDSNYDYPAVDLSDYRSGPTQNDYVIEGNQVLSNLTAPLSLRFVFQQVDTTQWDSCFAEVMGARLAHRGCFAITGSTALMKNAAAEYMQAVKEAARANALETPPTQLADDSWVATRPVGAGGAPTLRYG